MNRLDRALGILLLLRSGTAISARELAERFEVSPRTIYRDIATLSTLGVPLYTERGRGGGIRLLGGYFLPPVMLTRQEALALALGLALLGSLRTKPFAADMETAGRKLAAAVPEALGQVLSNIHKRIGFELQVTDVFHPESSAELNAHPNAPLSGVARHRQRESITEGEVITTFVQAIVEGTVISLHYRSPYRSAPEEIPAITPMGAFWDRGYWYLLGIRTVCDGEPRFWRADRVVQIRSREAAQRVVAGFDVATYLGRQWLRTAMDQWAEEAPVRIRVTPQQAERLQTDWYYRHAHFEPLDQDALVMTFGETEQGTVLELLRWLGPGAELLEPVQWRQHLAGQLTEMLRVYGASV
jgi:predicted DNA-binding transcriptional regulator YafY